MDAEKKFVPLPVVLVVLGALFAAVAYRADLWSGGEDPPTERVLVGIDVLQTLEDDPLFGKRVGLITNHTGVDANGVRTADVLAKRGQLAALFSPEHGFAGELDEDGIPSGFDAATGVPIHSLYGETRRPTPEMLAYLDALVFDVQDVGVRFYTYVSTMGLAMEAAAEFGIPFYVLDRPNPLGGELVAGPVLDPDQRSFVAFHELPVQHGMTVGELARLFRAERGLDLDLQVVRMRHWTRAHTWRDTGLDWVAPSPNLPRVMAAHCYPGLGLLETTNVSVGRGTDRPFRVFGAPWIDGEALRDALHASLGYRPNKQGPPVAATTFTPTSREFAGQECSGVLVVNPGRTSLVLSAHLMCALRDLYRDDWDVDAMQRLLGDDATLEALKAGATPDELLELWEAESEAFRRRRLAFLCYS